NILQLSGARIKDMFMNRPDIFNAKAVTEQGMFIKSSFCLRISGKIFYFKAKNNRNILKWLTYKERQQFMLSQFSQYFISIYRKNPVTGGITYTLISDFGKIIVPGGFIKPDS